MRFFCSTISLILILGITETKAFGNYDNQIKEICKSKKNKSNCIKDLENKKNELIEGKSIKIPVFRYKNKS